MNDLKNTLLIIGGVVVVFFGIIFGLSRIGDQTSTINKVDVQTLLDGARFIKENPSTISDQGLVTVVVFADIQCPSCKAANEELKPLETMQGVKYVMRQFPLPPNVHPYALISAKAVEAARVMDKGWEMVDLMFEKQSEWSSSKTPEKLFIEYAKSLGLNEKDFEEKMKSNEVAEMVQVDARLADSLRLSGTPTVFVDGEQVGVPFVIDKVSKLLSK